jgi:Flp pilus assembly protein TadG
MGSRPHLLATLDRLRRAFRRDRRGGVLPVVAISLPVIFGFAMLAVDAGRYFNLHTSVQWAADALALAGAAELDRKSDAITRANRAIDNLVANDRALETAPSSSTAAF